IPRSDVAEVVAARWRRMVLEALSRMPPQPPQPLDLSVPTPRTHEPSAPPITLSAGAQYAWHVTLAGPRVTSGDTTLQVQVGEDAPLQRIFHVSYNVDSQDALV